MKKNSLFLIGFSIFLIIVFSSCGAKKEILFSSDFSQESESLIPLDKNAKSGSIKDLGYADYKFTEKHKAIIKEVFERTGSASVAIKAIVSPSEKQQELLYSMDDIPFYFGFLYKGDFNSNGKLNESSMRNISSITAKINAKKVMDDETASAVFVLSLAMGKSDKGELIVPEGLFVYSAMHCDFVFVNAVETVLGYDKTSESLCPYFGFSANGGIADTSYSTADFSAASLVFPTEKNYFGALPEITIKYSDNPNYKSVHNAEVYVQVKAGNERFQIKNVACSDKSVISSMALKTPFSRFQITENKDCVDAVLMKAVRPITEEEKEKNIMRPIKADPGFMVNYSMEEWRNKDYEIFQWDRFPEILLFDFRNYAIQARFFTRIAFFVEKAGAKGTLLTNEQLGNAHGYNAHDYRAESFAEFYNLATETDFRLNKEELLLKDILIDNGILIADGKKVLPGKGGIASVSRESVPSIYWQLLNHEAYHTLYFIDDDFRNFVAAAYFTMDPDTRDFLTDYFKAQPSLGYDVTDEYLMKNEFMAYIMQQKVSATGNYFASRAGRASVMAYTPSLAQYVISNNGAGFTEAAKMLDSYAFDRYGLACGNVTLVTKY